MSRGWRPDPSVWGLERREGRLFLDGHELAALVERHGTPLYVASARALRARCGEFARAFAGYPGPVSLHFSYKCNPVAGLLRVIHGCGLGAEVCGGHELWLARALGVPGADVVFNGSNKSDRDLRTAVEAKVGLFVVDDVPELRRLDAVAASCGERASVALRVCPDIRPRGINPSFITGSRRGQFGLDRSGGEVDAAIDAALSLPRLRLRGVMAHLGSGVQDPGSFEVLVDRLLRVSAAMRRRGADAPVLDVGGGLGTRHARPFGTWDMLAYHGMGRWPRLPPPAPPDLVARYADVVCEAAVTSSRRLDLPIPQLVLEPGRAIAGEAQVLLLTIGGVRERKGLPQIAFADGGAVTVSLMFLTEQHAVLLANRDAPPDGPRASVFGPLPSPMDVVYRGLPLPRLKPGDILAVMDAGAYFTPSATHFGVPRPAVVLLDGAEARLVRRRETSEDIARVELSLHEESPR